LKGLEEGLRECSAEDVIRAVEELVRMGTPPKHKIDVYNYIKKKYGHCSKLGKRAFYYLFKKAERGVRGRRVVETPDGFVVEDGHKDVILKACRLVLCLTQPKHEPDVGLACSVLEGELYEQSGGRLGEVVEMALEHVITARGERVEVAKEIAKILGELREARERLSFAESEVDKLIREENGLFKAEYLREIDSVLGSEVREYTNWGEILTSLARDIPHFLSDAAGYVVEGYELREACFKAVPHKLSKTWRAFYETLCMKIETLKEGAPITYDILQAHMRMRTSQLRSKAKELEEKLQKWYSEIIESVNAFYKKSTRTGFIEGWCEDCNKGFVSDEVREAIRGFVKAKIKDKIKADLLTTLRSHFTPISY
jgi:hypothetical protein